MQVGRVKVEANRRNEACLLMTQARVRNGRAQIDQKETTSIKCSTIYLQLTSVSPERNRPGSLGVRRNDFRISSVSI